MKIFSSQSLITSFSDLATLNRTFEVAAAAALLFWPRCCWRGGSSSHQAFSFSVGLSLVEAGEEAEVEEEVEDSQSCRLNPLDCPAPVVKKSSL